jgi:hypothetical protein
MSYKTNIQSLIYNDSTVQSLVTSYVQSTTTKYMIWQGSLIPKKVSTDTDSNYEPTPNDKTINHYTASNRDGGKPIVLTTQIVSCRAYKETDATDIQDAVFDALNRIKSDDNCSFFVCSKLPVIPPADSTDNYNAQVEVSVKSSN